ncbi:efflux RND transporter periplasmic adaptor subunit [Roseospira marina]|uniref:Efflux RND transporter periplasmic adaptor subunit n=1 Tax=Roseospira marina TaxID=140057 RepID=A0A5M6IAM9_9PROT|nr:efflux RND transporter periplasmic adaptor subunit [Roseospira marina]KAA5605263.1 efflux RND transporter periplasmic adaptor subunit [Roseospira marina]MBB4314723.1 RND family efflux transporter MFP subunit [Roseospira marina]MBB5087712.1 RND family efflux transporter MFP subunit [Roseospira marina]
MTWGAFLVQNADTRSVTLPLKDARGVARDIATPNRDAIPRPGCPETLCSRQHLFSARLRIAGPRHRVLGQGIPMRMAVQSLLAVAILGAAAVAYQYGGPILAAGDTGGPNAASATRAGPPVVVEPVVMRPQTTNLEAIGTGEAIRSATLHPASAGEVVAVGFRPDQRVAPGDILLELDARRENLALDLAEARVAEAKRLLKRYETAGRGAVPASTVDEARTTLEAARITRREAQVALDDRTMTAPFAGHVGITEIDIGDRVTTEDAITTLDDRSALLVRFALPETVLGRVAVGQSVTIAPWGSPEAERTARLVDIGSRIDTTTRSVTLRARVENTDDTLRPGMSFVVHVNLTGQTYPLVPEIAVQWGAEGPYLWVIRGGQAARESVRIVERRQGITLVEGALEDGEPVVVEGIQRMRPGIDVSLADPLPTPPGT